MQSRLRTVVLWGVTVGVLCAGLSGPVAGGRAWAAGATSAEPLNRLVDAYFDFFCAANPTEATAEGVHAYDRALDDLSAQAVAKRIELLQTFEARAAKLSADGLSSAQAIDLEVLRGAIAAQRVEWQRIQPWRHRPDVYSGLATRSVYVLVKRDFAPLATRLDAVVAREEQIPALLDAGKHNLSEVAPIFVTIALDELPGIVDFFRDVPTAFATLDKGARARLERSTALAVHALEDYRHFLEQLLPHAHGQFAIGEPAFVEKLKADELITTPLGELLTQGEAELHRLQSEFKKVAARIDPHKSPAEVQRQVASEHGPAAELIRDTEARLSGLRQFLVDHAIVTIPSEARPRVQETPPFLRATTMASMDTPGSFEVHANEAFYNVTLPDPTWTPAQVEDFLRGAFSRALVDIVSIHEVFPGHYLQFLWVPHLASKIRKFTGANTNIEGWAHYTEEMLLDEGYGHGEAKLRLAQLQDALLRAARFVVGIRLHTRGMTVAEAERFFQTEGYQTQQVARMEARRGTEDPTYLYYTLGKLEILRLRDDYRRHLGPRYSLRAFHDAFLAEGPIPLPLIRRQLLY